MDSGLGVCAATEDVKLAKAARIRRIWKIVRFPLPKRRVSI
jgi:hypothetical protein